SPESLAWSLAEALAELLPAPQRYALAGFSFGGIIAAHLAALEGERVDKLALFGPGGFGPPLGQTPHLRRLTPDMGMREIIALHRHNLGRLMLADPDKVDDLSVFMQIENTRRARLRAGAIPQSDALMRALPEVRAQFHTVWSERDATTAGELPQREQRLRRVRPDLKFHLIPAAGHWTPYEAPDRVNAILSEMLSSSCA
ncbi:MAG: alpha/beta fold hydrolase, partial [Candidatus Binataceae bacterium]